MRPVRRADPDHGCCGGTHDRAARARRNARAVAGRVPGPETIVIGYKFLRSDGTSLFTGFRWPLPEAGRPGSWVEATGGRPEGQGGGKDTVAPCRSGIHACRPADLPPWIG